VSIAHLDSPVYLTAYNREFLSPPILASNIAAVLRAPLPLALVGKSWMRMSEMFESRVIWKLRY